MSRSMKSLLLGLGIIAAIGAGFSAFILNRGPRPEADVEVIARGEEVDLAIHVAPGKNATISAKPLEDLCKISQTPKASQDVA